ncbi:MAG: hypothetical protein KJZ83_16525, partial [Burkholderiaceae bacterium]|nr:hypothetical protein [Burkholderiaceae bacterium]
FARIRSTRSIWPRGATPLYAPCSEAAKAQIAEQERDAKGRVAPGGGPNRTATRPGKRQRDSKAAATKAAMTGVTPSAVKRAEKLEKLAAGQPGILESVKNGEMSAFACAGNSRGSIWTATVFGSLARVLVSLRRLKRGSLRGGEGEAACG